MSNQETEGVANEKSDATPKFAEQVNTIVKQMTKDEKGNWKVPDGEYSEELRYAVNAERRRRDAESAFGKSHSKLKAQDTLIQNLTKQAASNVHANLTQEQKTELEELKFSAPEAWRNKLNELEQSAMSALQEDLGKMTSEATQQAEIEARKLILSDFRDQHPEVEITDEVIANDIPPRITKRLTDGLISFEEFLTEAYNFLTSPKSIKKDDVKKEPSLSKAGGSSTPDQSSIDKDTETNYKDVIF